MNVLSVFDGMSCGQIALERAGIEVDNYFASEIDKYAIRVTQNNYPDTIQLGDIRSIKVDSLPKIDLLIGGSPCQGFSFAGSQLNFNDPRSALFFEYVRLLRELTPRYFLLENVPMIKKSEQVITDQLGVEPVRINSDLFVCQSRQRLYWTNIPVPELPIRENWDNQYYQFRRSYIRENKKGVCPTLTASMGTGGGNVPLQKVVDHGVVDRETAFCLDANYYKGGNLKSYYDKSRRQLVFEGSTYRKLTPVECERLQTVPDNYTAGVSDTQRYKMLGNGWTVDVIAHIFKGMLS